MTPPEPNDFVANPLVLRCTEVIELVTDYLDDALDAGDKNAIERHLAGCEGCVIFVAQIRRTVEITAAVGRRENITPLANLGALSALVAQRKGGDDNKGLNADD